MPDYIIVGGGSAGCALAARLSEKPEVTVLLLEAGPPDRNMYIHLPVGFFKMTTGPLLWGYQAIAKPETGDRLLSYAQARVLGGGSSINAQVFTRGCPEDFDAWEEEGCAGWSYHAVRPYFVKSEGNDTFAGPHHGTDGPLGVSSIHPHPLTRAFVRAAQQAGLPFNPDFNAGDQKGAGFYQSTTRAGRRSSSATAYLKPALDRPNLEVRTNTAVRRIVIEHGRAVGVQIVSGKEVEVIRADVEVLVCSGAIGSPRMLMLSGIGPADHLSTVGVDVVHDLPGVGENLQDHTDVDILSELNGSHGIDRYKTLRWKAAAALEYGLFKKGPVASNIVEAGAFWWGDPSAKTPDLQLHFLPGAGVEQGVDGVPGGHGCTLNSYFVRPRSRGTVRLRSSDPNDMPIVDPNALSDPYDLERAVDGIELSRAILSQPSLRRLIKQEHIPGPAIVDRKACAQFAREHGRSAYHPVGTCRMGRGDTAVVDHELRVLGVEALRICDSSVMPRLVSSNTNAATIMIAEKAADMIIAG